MTRAMIVPMMILLVVFNELPNGVRSLSNNGCLQRISRGQRTQPLLTFMATNQNDVSTTSLPPTENTDNDDNDDNITCFVIHDDDGEDTPVDSDASSVEPPHVVCTSEPDEYAWFSGLDPHQMTPLDENENTGTSECVEGASPRGIPEWECK